METVTIQKKKFELMQREIKTLRNTKLYKRLLACLDSISKKEFTRKDIGS
jgi:hypothetical protein